MRRKAFSGALVAAAITMLTAACGSASPAQSADHSAQTTVAADRNHADVKFASEMIPHHSQAVDMARLVPDRAQSPQVKDLARRIEAAQDPEIQQMRGWLTAWGAHAPGSGGHGHESSGAQGMMTAEQMTELKQISGSAFDKRFLQMMIEHHEGAIAASQQQLTAGANREAKALAEQIIKTQQTEIAEMRGLLGAS